MDDSATEILDATHRALREHGYADLTVEAIAQEADTSTSLIHYYFDDKDALLAAFLDHLYARYTAHLASATGDTPREELFALLEAVLGSGDDRSRTAFRTAMLEVKAQAPYDDAVQERLVEFDEALYDRLRTVIAAGVESGDFRERVDPVVAAEFLVTAITGARTRQVAIDHSAACLYETMTRYAESQLLAEERSEVAR